MKIKTVAIVGAGIMGSDVALTRACHGIEIILKDVQSDILDQSKQRIIKKLLNVLKKLLKAILKI